MMLNGHKLRVHKTIISFALVLICLVLSFSCGCSEKPVTSSVSVSSAEIIEQDLSLPVDQLLNKYNFSFFMSLKDAVDSANQGVVSDKAVDDIDNAVAALYLVKNQTLVILLKNTVVTETIDISKDMIINLGGNTLEFENVDLAFQLADDHTDTIIFDGRLSGSSINLAGTDEKARIFATKSNTINVIGGSYIAKTSGENAKVVAAYIDKEGSMTLTDCTIKAYSNYTYSSDVGYKACSMGIYNLGTLVTKNCNVFGTHSGLQTRGSTKIDGGIFEGFGHGGIYFCGPDAKSYVKNATIRECEMLTGYVQNAGNNHAGFYIGGVNGNNIVVYMDNCLVYGKNRPIVLRGTSNEQNNSIYISNSKINLSQNNGIRIDNASHKLYIGIGNDFDAKDIKPVESVITTDEVYCTDM